MACRVLPFAVAAALILALAGCSNYETTAPARLAWRGGSCLSRAKTHSCLGLCAAGARNRRTRHLRPDPAVQGERLARWRGAFQFGLYARLPDDRRAQCVADGRRAARRAGAVRPAGGRDQFDGRLQLPDHEQSVGRRGFPNMRLAMPSTLAGFRLADGREILIVRDWTRGDDQTRAFLQDVHSGACGTFTTVLGPGANIFHYNHIHVDLALHGNTSTGPRRICRPQLRPSPVPEPPRDSLPNPPEIDEDIDIAQAGIPPTSLGVACGTGTGADGAHTGLLFRGRRADRPPRAPMRRWSPRSRCAARCAKMAPSFPKASHPIGI